MSYLCIHRKLLNQSMHHFYDMKTGFPEVNICKYVSCFIAFPIHKCVLTCLKCNKYNLWKLGGHLLLMTANLPLISRIMVLRQ